MRGRISMAEKGKGGKKGEALNQEQVIAQFQKLRQEQKAIATKIAELEGEKQEHEIVIETLRGVDEGRRCFRMVGEVLVERTVKDVLPALQYNSQQLSLMVKKLMEQLEKKGKQLNEFREKHNIRIQGEKEKEEEEEKKDSGKASGSQGVLVS